MIASEREAVTRPTMRFVPVKSPEEQAAGMVLKTRELLVRQRSQTANAIRGHMAELGIIAAAGMTSIAKLIAILRDDQDGRLPHSAKAALLEMADQIERLTGRDLAAWIGITPQQTPAEGRSCSARSRSAATSSYERY